jgi:hypothetical protein
MTSTFIIGDDDCVIIIPKNGEPSMIMPSCKNDETVGRNVLAGVHLYMQLADGVDVLAAAFEKQASEVAVQ